MELKMPSLTVGFVAIALISAAACAVAAPGEDPVQIQRKVTYLELPTAAPAGSGSIQHRTGLPDDAKAKMAKYVAKSYSMDTGTVVTEKNVVSTAKSNGLGTTTCVQSVGAPPATGSSAEQVVVIRGDLVNICR